MLLHALGGAPRTQRRAFFEAVRSCRRRRQTPVGGAPIGRVLSSPDAYDLILRRAVVAAAGARAADRGLFLLDVFRAFDADHDSALSCSELFSGLRFLLFGPQVTKAGGLSADLVRDLVRRGDVDGDGLLSFAEFKRLFGGVAARLGLVGLAARSSNRAQKLSVARVRALATAAAAAGSAAAGAAAAGVVVGGTTTSGGGGGGGGSVNGEADEAAIAAVAAAPLVVPQVAIAELYEAGSSSSSSSSSSLSPEEQRRLSGVEVRRSAVTEFTALWTSRGTGCRQKLGVFEAVLQVSWLKRAFSRTTKILSLGCYATDSCVTASPQIHQQPPPPPLLLLLFA
jgi:hypothetical protein